MPSVSFAANAGRGIPSALGAAVLFGISTPLAKLALTSTSPLLVAGLLYLGSGIGLAMLQGVRRVARRPLAEATLTRRDLPWLLGSIAAGGIVAPMLLLFGLVTTPASSASLLLNVEAVATAAIAWMIFRENVDRRVGLGFAFILVGGILLSIPHGGGIAFSTGALLIVGACLCWGIDNNLTRTISGCDPMQIAMWKGLVAGTVNVGLALSTGARLPAVETTVLVALVGFVGYGMSLVLFVRALRDLGTARTGAYFSTAPFVGAALAFALGQGRLDWNFATAGILMLAGVWLHVTERHDHVHTHEPVIHDHLHIHDEHHQHEHGAGDPAGEPHSHSHRHEKLTHRHAHFPDLHHRHEH